MEELDKKIAEWCGLKSPHIDDLGHAIYWKEGYEGGCPVPHFTRSLDACFKYIVPKLKLMYLTIWDGFEAHLAIRLPHERYEVYVGKAETPALAFCRPVEKMIDN